MAIRVEENKTMLEALQNLELFLTQGTQVYDVDYSSSYGNGNIKNITVVEGSPEETWTLQCKSVGQTITFSVEGNLSGTQPDATVGAPYDNGIVSFTIENGSTPWQQGDIVTFKVSSGAFPKFRKAGNVSMGVARRLLSKISQAEGFQKNLYGNPYVVFNDKPKKDGHSIFVFLKGLLNPSTDFYYNSFPSLYCLPTLIENQAVWDSAPESYSISFWLKAPILYYRNNGEYGSTFLDDTKFASIFNGTLFSGAVESVGDTTKRSGFTLRFANDGSTLQFCRTHPNAGVGFSDTDPNKNDPLNTSTSLVTVIVEFQDFLTKVAQQLFPDNGFDWQKEWLLITVSVDKSNNTVSVFANDTLIETQSVPSDKLDDFAKTYPIVNKIATSGLYYNIVIWGKALNTEDVINIYNSEMSIPSSNPDVFDTIDIDLNEVTYEMRLLQTDKNIPLAFTLTKFINDTNYALEAIATYKQSPVSFIDAFTSSDDSSYIFNPIFLMSWSAKPTSPDYSYEFWTKTAVWESVPTILSRFPTILTRSPFETVSKYWFVTDGETVVVIFKYFDENTSQQDPVYEILYVGQFEDSYNSTCIGIIGSHNNSAPWTDDSESHTFGVFKEDSNIAVIDESLNRFVNFYNDSTNTIKFFNFPQDEFYSKVQPADGTKYTILPILVTSFFTDVQYYNRQSINNKSFCGKLKFIRSAVPNGLTVEDELLIDGNRYVIIRDTHNSTPKSMFAIQLKEN